MTAPAATPPIRRTLRRFLLAVAVGNLLWEAGHVPLYTLWLTGTGPEIAYAVLHCTAGDVLIAATTLCLAIAAFGRTGWPDRNYRTVALAMTGLAIAYTIFSEWLNVEVRGSWAYRAIMPRLPPFGTGLTPILQWIIVPLVAFALARPRRDAGK